MTDRLAKFVGMETYVAAGGAVLRDLFDETDEGYLTDRVLLTRLATAKMEAAVASVQAEGWKWVRPELTRDHSVHYGRIWGVVPDDEDEDSDEGAERVFTPEDKARAGARLSIDYNGRLEVERGLIHPDDAKALAGEDKAERGATAARESGLSAVVVEELTAHHTAALRIELARNPTVALAATVHAPALPLLYGGALDSCLKLRGTSKALDRHT